MIPKYVVKIYYYVNNWQYLLSSAQTFQCKMAFIIYRDNLQTCMLCDYLLGEQYVFRYGSHVQAQDGTGCIWRRLSESCTFSFGRPDVEDSQSTVSCDNLDIMLPKREGLS